jgi:hypothetical protein
VHVGGAEDELGKGVLEFRQFRGGVVAPVVVEQCQGPADRTALLPGLFCGEPMDQFAEGVGAAWNSLPGDLRVEGGEQGGGQGNAEAGEGFHVSFLLNG